MSSYRPEATVRPINLQSVFLLKEKNRNFLQDRTQKLYSPAEAIKGLILILALVNLILICVLGRNTWRWWQFTTNGVITEAKVIAREIDDSDDSTSYYLTYEYSARRPEQARQLLTNRDQVNSSTYRHYEPGTFILIRYLKQDPTNVTSKWHPWWIWQLGAGYGLALFLLWLGGLYLPHYYRKRIATILTHGQVIPGHVLTSKGNDSDGSYQVEIGYEFASPTGHVLKGRNSETRNDLKNKALPAIETPIAVMYLTDKDFFLL